MNKIRILIILLTTTTFLANSQTSQEIDTSECFLADTYLSHADFVLAQQQQKESSINLRFHVYRFFSSCYDIEAMFQKQNNLYKMRKSNMDLDEGTMKDNSVFIFEIPSYELQQICEQSSQRRLNNCKLIFKIYRKNTEYEVAQTIFTAEAAYTFHDSFSLLSFKIIDVRQYQTQYRQQLKSHFIQNPSSSVPQQTSVYYYEKQQIDPFFPIKLGMSNQDKKQIEFGTIYGESSEIYQVFRTKKQIDLNFVNYPTKEILNIKQGRVFQTNSTELIDNNSTQIITLLDNQLSINFNEQIDIVQELLLQDDILTIKAFLRIKYVEGESFLIERLPNFDTKNTIEDFDIKEFIVDYQLPIALSMMILMLVITFAFIFQRYHKKTKIEKGDKTEQNLINVNQISNDQQKQLNDLEEQ